MATDEPNYVGTQSCVSCHEAEAAAWKDSHHDLAMDHATPDTVLGDFDGARVTAGGVTFAAFPLVYAVMFSSLYSALMLILFALILRGVSFELSRGEMLAITGPSGAGKSTLLHLLGGLDRPTSGTYVLDSQDVSKLSRDQLAGVRNKKIGFVFQSFLLIPTLSAVENVQVPMFESPRKGRERTEHARQLLAAVGLTHRERHLPAQLSVGERQRVAIARAVINEPDLLIADEPTGNLDEKTGGHVLDYLFDLTRERGNTLILVTHDRNTARRCDRIRRTCGPKTASTSAPEA